MFEKLTAKIEGIRNEAQQQYERRIEQEKRASDSFQQFKVQLYRQLDEMSLKNVKVAGELRERIQQCEVADTKFEENSKRVEHHF